MLNLNALHHATGLPKSVISFQTTVYNGTQCSDHVKTTSHNGLNNLPYEPYGQFNLALHVGDEAQEVAKHRMELLAKLQSQQVQAVVWLNQTHGLNVFNVDNGLTLMPPDADALFTEQTGLALAILTADCLPLVLTDTQGSTVAVIHAGWRGLCDGIIEQTVAKMRVKPTCAWLGAAIGPCAFEVGDEVRQAFVDKNAIDHRAFNPGHRPLHWVADLYQLATTRLQACGIIETYGGGLCTVSDMRWYSYRRHAKTGRMATVAFIQH